MTDKELRKLKRRELLEMLLEQSKEVERLNAELEAANKLLEKRTIEIEESGSIAEVSLKLNGVFEAAEASAKQYLENIERLNANQESICAQREKDCEEKVQQMMIAAKKRCEEMEEQAKKRCEERLQDTIHLVKEQWDKMLDLESRG